MFIIELQFKALLLYYLSFVAIWLINYVLLIATDKLYEEQQGYYFKAKDELYTKLQELQKEKSLKIEEYEDTHQNNFKLDIEHLHTRADKVINSMNSVAENKYKSYIAKKEECKKKIEDLMNKIIKDNTS